MRFGNLIPLGNLKPRSWVLKKLLLRGEITTLIAAGGVGKSQLALSMAIALALGENLFGFENATPSVPQHSIIYNAEDSLEEMSMRLHATCNALNLDPEKISPYIVLVSAKDLRPGKFKLLSVNEHGQVVVTDDTKKIINWLIEACHKYKPALVCFDPLGKLHEVNESDNIVIGRLMENMTTILAECNAAGLLCHHESKPSTYGPAATAAAMSRGAVEIVNGSRAAFRLSSPTDADANRWNMSDQIRRRLVRLDDAKNNRTLGGEPTTWIEKASIKLPSGEDVGAFVPPKVLEGADEGRQQMARVLIAEITAAGKGAVPLAEAASMLQRADPLYAQLTPKQVQVRVEAVIGSGVEADGGRVSVQSDGRSRRVQLG
jgi:hypothetical protein